MTESMLAAVQAAAQGDTVAAAAAPAPLTIETLRASHPVLCAVLEAEGAAAERARIQGVEAQMLAGHGELIARLKFDGKTTPEQAAVQVLAAERAHAANRKASLDADEAKMKGLASEHGPANGPASDKPAAPGAGLEGEAKWKAQYAADAKLQGEFRSEGNYIAFKKSEAAGLVRIARGKVA